MSYHFEFYTNMTKPYISTCIEYDLSGSEGCIHFNGYYYIGDSAFPQKLYMEVCQDLSGSHISKYYYAEFYSRVYYELDGTCYFPTMEQKLYFRILKEYTGLLDLIDEIRYRVDDYW